jgi:hypothetical protein
MPLVIQSAAYFFALQPVTPERGLYYPLVDIAMTMSLVSATTVG